MAWSRSEFPATFKWKDEDPADKGKEKAVEPPKTASSEEEANVDQVLTLALIARAATCAYLYFGHANLFGSRQAFDTSASILLEQSSVVDADSPLQHFLRWDALYYVKIALEGYRHEQELAFLPGWPLCMRIAGEAVRYARNFKGKGPTGLDVFDVVVGGVVMANALSVAASVAFYK